MPQQFYHLQLHETLAKMNSKPIMYKPLRDFAYKKDTYMAVVTLGRSANIYENPDSVSQSHQRNTIRTRYLIEIRAVKTFVPIFELLCELYAIREN